MSAADGAAEPGGLRAAAHGEDHARWAEADVAARPARLERLRARFESLEVDAYFGIAAREQPLPDRVRPRRRRGEGRGPLGPVPRRARRGRRARRFAVQDPGRGERRRARGSSTPATTCRALARSRRVGRCEAGRGRGRVRAVRASWRRLEAAAPDVELVPVEGWVEADRATKEPSELERVAAACAIADRALATLLPRIVAGRVREGARARAGVAAADRRRGDDRVRPDVPRRSGGRDAPRIAVAMRSSRPVASSCSTSVPRSTAIAAT